MIITLRVTRHGVRRVTLKYASYDLAIDP